MTGLTLTCPATLHRSINATSELSWTLKTLTVNGTLTGSSIKVVATGNISVGFEGNLSVSSMGYSAGAGPGKGLKGAHGGGGAGYAGYGGNGANTSGSAPYGSYYLATSAAWLKGSGGGASRYGTGGAGGGRLKLVAPEIMHYGYVSADGQVGGDKGGGGGSGGSIVFNATVCTGGTCGVSFGIRTRSS